LPICQSSLISINRAEISLKQEASFGNTPTTLVLLWFSLFILSRLFVILIDLRCSSGKSKTVKPSARFSSIQADSRVAERAYFSMITLRYCSAVILSGTLNIARILAATSFRNVKGLHYWIIGFTSHKLEDLKKKLSFTDFFLRIDSNN